MQITNTLKELLSIPAISGFESDFHHILKNKLYNFCSDVKITSSGCVLGIIPSKNSCGKSIMIEAHLDRIGLIVSEILEDGFLKFKTVGGVDERILPTAEVTVLGRESVYGVIGAKPPHLLPKAEEKDTLKIENMTIDTGFDTETLKSKISVGDPVLLNSKFSELLCGRVASAALDNRAGMTAVFESLEKIMDSNCPYDIYICFTKGEETGLHGAYTLGKIKPDLAIVVDVTHGTTPDAPKTGTFPLGSGVAICRGPNLHYDYTLSAVSLAKKKNISYTIEVASGHTGTNAWAIQTLAGGIPCVLLSIPLRYMHTSVEVVDISDIEATASLISELVSGGVELA